MSRPLPALRLGLLGAALAAAPAAAQAPPPAAGGSRRGFLLYLEDRAGILNDDIDVVIVGESGLVRKVKPNDRGRLPDAAAGDRRLTASAPDFADARVYLTIPTKAGEALDVEADLGDRAGDTILVVALEAGGKVEVRTESADIGAGRVLRTQKDATQLDRVAVGAAFSAGATLGAGVGAVLLMRGAGAWVRGPRRRPGGRQAPLRLRPDEVPALLAGDWAGHRVVVVGPLPASPGSAALFPCREPAPIPAEAVAQVEDLALLGGAVVALLVTDPAALDRGGALAPLVDLGRLVAGRFPLAIVER